MLSTRAAQECGAAGDNDAMEGLALHRFLLRFALAGASVFAWLFVFHFFSLRTGSIAEGLARTALLYMLSATVTCLATPVAARALRVGARRTMLFALLFAAAAFVVLGATFGGFWDSTGAASAITVFAVLLGMYRALYWVPYAVETGVAQHRQGRWGEILIALAPVTVGVFIATTTAAPTLLFYIAALLVICSALPLTRIRDVQERFSWAYRQTFHELLSREHRAYVTHGILEGMVGAALLLFWPLAVFLLIGWSYAVLGVVLSISLLVAIFLRAPVRSLLRRAGSPPSPVLTSILALTPWLFRLSVASPLGVVLVDSYFYTTTPRRHGIDPFAFEQVSDGGSLIDEYTALKEMALCLGKMTVCALAVVCAAISVPVAFVAVFTAAALASLWLAFTR